MSYVFSSIQNKHYFWGGFQANKESAMRTWIAPRLELAIAPLKKKKAANNACSGARLYSHSFSSPVPLGLICCDQETTGSGDENGSHCTG